MLVYLWRDTDTVSVIIHEEGNMTENTKKQIREAIAAADEALANLYEVRKYLGKSRRLGILDYFGGGFLINMTKHKRIEMANVYFRQAKPAVRKFNKELHDIPGFRSEEFGGGMVSADSSNNTFVLDVWTDSLAGDYIVQERIREARASNDKLIEQIEMTRDILKDKLVNHD